MRVTNRSSHAVWMFTSSFAKTSFKVHPSHLPLEEYIEVTSGERLS
jgi:hypothetical protein